MKMNKNKTLACGNYKCYWNCDGCCSQDVIALDANAKCTLEKIKTAPAKSTDKTSMPYDYETSK